MNLGQTGLSKMKPVPPLTPADKEEAVKLFHAVDTDKDGKINDEELKVYLQGAPWALSYIGAAGFDWRELWEAPN